MKHHKICSCSISAIQLDTETQITISGNFLSRASQAKSIIIGSILAKRFYGGESFEIFVTILLGGEGKMTPSLNKKIAINQ